MLFQFEDCVLDDQRRELRRGADIIPVEPKTFDLLCHLIRNRDRVVTHDDLFAAVWEGRVVSMSTLGSSINAARAAVGDSGEAQRLIQTFPRKGFRFVGAVSEASAPRPATPIIDVTPPFQSGAEALPVRTAVQLPPDTGVTQAAGPPQNVTTLPTSRFPALPAMAIGAIVAFGIAGAFFYLLKPAATNAPRPSLPVATQPFDASVVPLITDEDRRSLSTYPSRPEIKVVAIGSERFSVVDNATDVENAKQEALKRCNTTTTRCRIYAVGMDVIWSKAAIPLADPGDLRTEPLALPLVPADVPTLSARRRELVAPYLKALDHRAVALTTGRSAYVTGRASRAEAIRLAVERCGERAQRPCLILSVDGHLTVQIPKTRKVDRIFLPSTEPDLSDADRARIARIYSGREWRALAHGKNGSWHAVADAPSEAAAIESALKLCAQSDEGCRIYAVGNFGVVRAAKE